MATVKTSKTTVVEYEEKELAIRNLEISPELFQVRVNLDKKWSRLYSEGYVRGDALPPILAYRLRLADEWRLVVVDGFHRIDACLAIGKKTIRVQIREGTMQEAIIAAIEANTAELHQGREFTDDDRKHAAELMLTDPEMWFWADKRIGGHVEIGLYLIRNLRLELKTKLGRELPLFVIKSNGQKVRYRSAQTTGEVAISKTKDRPSFKARFRNKWYRGKTEDEVKAKVEAARAATKDRLAGLKHNCFSTWLSYRGFTAKTVGRSYGPHGQLTGLATPTALLATLPEPGVDAFCIAAYHLHLLAQHEEMTDRRKVLVGYSEDFPAELIDLARKDGIEFLTPDELVASLGGSQN